jgi:hypothetical protein
LMCALGCSFHASDSAKSRTRMSGSLLVGSAFATGSIPSWVKNTGYGLVLLELELRLFWSGWD